MDILVFLKMVETQHAASAAFENQLMAVSGILHVWAAQSNPLPQAFRVFDSLGTGTVEARDFKRALSSLGSKMAPAQVAAVLRAIGVRDEGLIDYVDVVRTLASS